MTRGSARRAVILAGGKGTRLRPYTTTIPKPLMPIGDRPILDIVLRQLRRYGYERVTIVTGHLAELIEAYTGRGERYGLEIDFHREQDPLGTVGALASIADLDEPFLVMNGDVLTELDLGRVLDEHLESDAVATIATTTQEIHVPLGVMHMDPDRPDRVVDYVEKPTLRYQASMGVYAFSTDVLEHIEPEVYLDFPALVLRLLAAGLPVASRASDEFWLDVGRHEDFEQAGKDFERLRDRLLGAEERLES